MTSSKNINDIMDDIRLKRDEWRIIREKKLARKKELLALGHDKRSVRRDKTFKSLRKEQDRLSKLIRHAERRLSRVIASKIVRE